MGLEGDADAESRRPETETRGGAVSRGGGKVFVPEGPAWVVAGPERGFGGGGAGWEVGGLVDGGCMRVLAVLARAFTTLSGTVRGIMSLRNSRLSMWETAEERSRYWMLRRGLRSDLTTL